MSKAVSRFLGRVGQQCHLILRGHVLNAPWKPREARRKQRYRATRDAASRYLRRYASDICKATPERIDMTLEPERAFTIWFQGEEQAPPLVQACFRSMRRHLEQEVVILDEKTIFDWISLPEEIVRKWREGKIPHAHFSDMCRIELLYRHGGLWFDATDYVTAPVPQWIMDEDVFLFMSGSKIRGSYSFVQNCFLRARKGNPLFGIWREANFIYWKEEDSKINYFVHHLLLRLSVDVNRTAAEAFAKMPRVDQDPTHALWGEHCADPYDADEYRRLTEWSFFQKCNYKDKRLKTMGPDTMGSHMIAQS